MKQAGVADASGNNPNICAAQDTFKLSTSFSVSATGVGAAVFLKGEQTIFVKFTGTGTLTLEETLDNETTWTTRRLPSGTAISFTTDASLVHDFGDQGATVRFNCTAHGGAGLIYCQIGVTL